MSVLVQDKVDPVTLVTEELACLASNLRMCVTVDILNVPSLANAAEYFFQAWGGGEAISTYGFDAHGVLSELIAVSDA